MIKPSQSVIVKMEVIKMSKQRLTILIDEEEHLALKILAAESKLSMTDLVSAWISAGIKKAQTKKK